MDVKQFPTYFRLQNPDGSRIDFNDISLESLGMHMMFGEVSNQSIYDAVNFILKSNVLFAGNKEITLVLNTVGGETSEGFALIDMIEASRLDVRTVGMGNIISMGVLLMCAGTKGKRIMLKNSTVMAHQFSGYQDGKFHELVSTQQAFNYLKVQMVSHFVRHTRMTEKQVMDIMFSPTDRYLTPAECKKLGIVDKILDELPELNLDLSPPASSGLKRQSRK